MLAANINVSNYPNMSKMFFKLGKVDGGCGLWLHTPKNQRLEPFGINDWDLIRQIPGGFRGFQSSQLTTGHYQWENPSFLTSLGMISPATWAEFDHFHWKKINRLLTRLLID